MMNSVVREAVGVDISRGGPSLNHRANSMVPEDRTMKDRFELQACDAYVILFGRRRRRQLSRGMHVLAVSASGDIIFELTEILR